MRGPRRGDLPPPTAPVLPCDGRRTRCPTAHLCLGPTHVSKDDLPDLPELPSFEALGLSAEEVAELERELAEEGALESEADPELESLLGPTPAKKPTTGSPGGGAKSGSGDPAEEKPRTGKPAADPDTRDGTADKKAARAAKKAEKEAARARRKETKAAKRAESDARKRDAAEKKAGAEPPGAGGSPPGDGSPPDANAGPGTPATEGATATAGASGWRYRGPVTLGLLVVAAWLLSSFRVIPSPAPATTPETDFASARAMTHLVEIARDAHPPGSPEHARVRGYLEDVLRDLGLEPAVQTTTSIRSGGRLVRAATVRNIVARMPGSASTGAIVLTAHYDGLELSRAAGDDGVGVVTILETIRALRTGPQLRNDVIVLLTDGEELGLLGARAFVNEHPWMDDVAMVLSFEMRGGGGPSIMFETGAENGWVVDQLAAHDPAPFANSLMGAVYERMPNDTDFTPFREAGVQGLNFAAVGRAPVYHQQYDAPENLSEGTLQHHGIRALAMTRALGAADLTTVQAPNQVYLSVPLIGLVVYPPYWAYALSAVLLLLFGLVVTWARRGGAGIGGMSFGLIGFLVATGLAWALGVGAVRWLPRFHPEAGQLHGSLLHSEGWYVLALAAAAFAITVGVFGLLRRWFSVAELTTGALAVPVLLAALAGGFLPLGAMNLQWPALAGVLSLMVVTTVGKGTRPGALRWALLFVIALPVLAVMVPFTELLWLAMNLSLAPVLGAILVVTFVFFLPLADVVREPNGWWASVCGGVVAGLFLSVGLVMSGADAARPAPSTLLYAFDRESGNALWATDADTVMGGSSAARSWVEEKIGPVGEVQTLAAFTGRSRVGGSDPAFATAPAPTPSASVPVVALRSSTAGASAEIAIRSEIGAELIVVHVPESAPPVVSINGKPISGESPPLLVEHWGTPEGELRLAFGAGPGAEPISLSVVEHHYRPEELLEGRPFDRPAELAPNIRRMSDRALIRTPVQVDVARGLVTVAGTATTPFSDTAAVVDSVAADSVGAEPVPGAPDQATPIDTLGGAPSEGDVPGAADTIPADTTDGASGPAPGAADTLPRDTLPAGTTTGRRGPSPNV